MGVIPYRMGVAVPGNSRLAFFGCSAYNATMMLHIGDNKTIPQADIVVILPVPKGGKDGKTSILLADGRVIYSPISSMTLKMRLETFLPQDALGNASASKK